MIGTLDWLLYFIMHQSRSRSRESSVVNGDPRHDFVDNALSKLLTSAMRQCVSAARTRQAATFPTTDRTALAREPSEQRIMLFHSCTDKMGY
jgi:hypothetical protein